MNDCPDWLALDDAALLAQCDIHIYKSSGPGGQHRNKVSSAVRVKHRPTGVTAHGDDSRSQHENKALAIKRLRMNFALQIRRPVDLQTLSPDSLPPVVAECVFAPRGGTVGNASRRLTIGRKDHRFWQIAQFLLDLLEVCEGRVADAAGRMDINTSNFISVLKDDRHLFGAAQQIRKAHDQGPLK